MLTESVTLQLPVNLYRRVQTVARTMKQPLETFLLDAVTTALPLLDDLPAALANDVSNLALLNDAALWRAARRTWSASEQEQLDELLYRKEAGNLDKKGQRALDHLLAEYDRLMLIRAQAALLLKQRGYDVTDPATLNVPAKS